MAPQHYISGFKIVWLFWLCSGVMVVLISAKIRLRIRKGLLRELIVDDTGAGYTIAYLMTIPLYLLMVLMFFETSLMLIAKVGTVNAAFGAARSAIVWDSASDSKLQAKSEQAAVQGMAPYSSGLTALRLNLDAEGDGEGAFMAAYDDNRRSESQVKRSYVEAKYRYAARAISVDLAIETRTGGEQWDEDIAAKVTYDYPYLFPVLGRILGLKRRDGLYIHEISTTIPLQNETPRNEQKQLGISYASP